MIHFKDNGKHDIVTEFLFQPPQFDKKILHHVFNNCNTIINKLQQKVPLTKSELVDLQEIPINYLICELNDFSEAQSKLKEIKNSLRDLDDKSAYIKYKEAVRILRKVKNQYDEK